MLVHNCGDEPGPAPAGSTLEDYANDNQASNQESTPDFVSEYTSPSGQRYYGRTTPGGVDVEQGSVLDDILGNHHRGCAEVCAVNEAFKAEGVQGLFGGSSRTLRVRPLGSEYPSGTPANPCEDYCQPFIRRIFGSW